MDAFFIRVFVGPVSAALTRPTKLLHNLQTKKKTPFDVFLLEYWYRGWDSNPQAR